MKKRREDQSAKEFFGSLMRRPPADGYMTTKEILSSLGISDTYASRVAMLRRLKAAVDSGDLEVAVVLRPRVDGLLTHMPGFRLPAKKKK